MKKTKTFPIARNMIEIVEQRKRLERDMTFTQKQNLMNNWINEIWWPNNFRMIKSRQRTTRCGPISDYIFPKF